MKIIFNNRGSFDSIRIQSRFQTQRNPRNLFSRRENNQQNLNLQHHNSQTFEVEEEKEEVKEEIKESQSQSLQSEENKEENPDEEDVEDINFNVNDNVIRRFRIRTIKYYLNYFVLYVLFYSIISFVVTLRIANYNKNTIEYSLFLPFSLFMARLIYYCWKNNQIFIEENESK